jgi:hypothetical protein
VPGIVEDGARGGLLIALCGLCAMLPDTLDFKLVRYLEKADADIVPAVLAPDAQQIADDIAMQMYLASQTGHSRVVHLHPARKTVSEYVLYSIRFESLTGDVIVTLDLDGSRGSAHVGKLDYTYDGELHIEELGATSLRFSACGDSIRVEFLPWHRVWTHSLVVALVMSLAFGILLEPRVGLIAFLGYTVHVLEDQLGYMGSSLFAPISMKRVNGMGFLHSGDAIPNVVTVWISLALLLLNLDRARQTPVIASGPYLALVVLLPAVVATVIFLRRRWRAHKVQIEQERQRDVVAEAQEMP